MRTRWTLAALVGASVLAGPSAAAEPGAEGRIDAIFAPYARAEAPGCAVGISQAGRIELAKGYGAADLTWGRPITPDTVFEVASVTKQFTAFATVLLAQRGRLSLEDDVRKHLPDLPDYGARVTLAHLLEHTSGLPSYDTIATVTGHPARGDLDPDLAYGLARRIDALDFPPGSDFSYSNTNYLLLGRVVERVSGRPLGEFLAAEAFGPAGMSATRYAPDLGAILPGRASGYAPLPAGGFRMTPIGGSDGGGRGVQSNVKDLLAWGEALESGRLGAEVYRRMTTPRRLNGDSDAMRYAAGLDVDRLNGRRIVRHKGADWRGYTSELLRIPEKRLGVAVLCNRPDAPADMLAEKVAAAWLGEPVDSGQQAQPLSAAQRAAAGRYIAADGRTLELRLEGEQMTARPVAPAPLTPIADRAFAFGPASRGARILVEGGAQPTLQVVPPVGRALTYRRYEPVSPSPSVLAEYAGLYVNAGYATVMPFFLQEGRLIVTDLNGAQRPLTATTADRFVLGGNTGFTFERGADGRVARVVVAQSRARRLVFTRTGD